MSGKGTGGKPGPPDASGKQPPVKKKVKIRKDNKWVDVDVDSKIVKGRFKYVKFVDNDGLETYWISPE